MDHRILKRWEMFFFFLSDIFYLKVGSDLDLVIDITLHLSSVSDRVSVI